MTPDIKIELQDWVVEGDKVFFTLDDSDEILGAYVGITAFEGDWRATVNLDPSAVLELRDWLDKIIAYRDRVDATIYQASHTNEKESQ